jgi:sugar phosphate isomerase/epimerase
MIPNLLSGFADEAGHSLATQIRATKELGWSNTEMRFVQVPGYESGNLHEIPEAAFHQVVDELAKADIKVHCFGSALGNWAKDIRKPFDGCLAEAKRAAARMPLLGTKFIRIMSYPVLRDQADQMKEERFRRLREFVSILSDAGATVLHENCSNYGGMSWTHSLELLENVPGLKLVFDTGNPVGDRDHSKPELDPTQSSWEFYTHVREHILHLHIKDAVIGADGKKEHRYPGEGDGDVRRVITDLLGTGYTGAISIEPHLKIAPEFKEGFSEEEGAYKTYVEYGRRLEKILKEVTTR